ncbi:FUSC family protein [Erythrobacter sp. T5W1-R]|uniref:FUSC family protein n=1 Tax=Erythrobacter sp. T5W1-R TaxID=3101752 RepID=UPI002AFEDF38|nr:FUSC family protein [Erythrobacter sp. T5W1-R]MEA1619954.1 FUSC family protein [Erythrobacter sp. T5W1-R]
MAQPAAESDTLLTRVIPVLRPFPGRAGQALRLSVIAACATWLALYWGLPEAALAAYVPFFMWKPDRMLSTVLAVALMVIATLLIGTVILLAMIVLDDPMWRVATIASASFAICWLGSASKLKPVAPIMAMVIAFALDVMGANPLPVFTTKALLWAWWLVGAPALVTIVINLLVAPAPRRLLSRLIAERLYAAADALTGAEGGSAQLASVMRENPKEAALLLALAKAEHTSRRADIAAFASALQQSTAICLLAKALADASERLPADRALLIAAHLRAMGDILARDLYPTGTALALPETARNDQIAAIEAALLAAIADFTTAEPPPANTSQGGGFMEPDALTNPAHVHYALKTTGAAMACFLLYHALDWPGIHTAFLTCFIVALPTAAEAVEKLSLRLVGAMIGAAVGATAMLLLVPVLENGVQLAGLVLIATLPAAWLAVGSERISYVGFQWAFAFYLTVIQGSGPGFDITIARDRVIGVLLGNVATYFMFTRVWPVSIAPRVDGALREGLAALRAFAENASHGARMASITAAMHQFAEARAGLAMTRYEPANLLPHPRWSATRREMLDQIDADLPALFIAGERVDGTAHGIAEQLEATATRLQDCVSAPMRPSAKATEAAT